MKLSDIPFVTELPVPVEYKGIHLNVGYRLDFLVAGSLILELKSVDQIAGIHEAQLLTYMKMIGIRTGLLINFNVCRLADGVKRFKL